MARLSYQAPGVYVEEVPSAQKPIAGVGTNTVGFIGIVEDEIKYPKPNENYDPTRTAKGMTSTDQHKEEIKKKEAQIQQLEENKKQEDAHLKEAEEGLKKPGLNDNQKKELNDKKTDAQNKLAQIENEIKEANRRMAVLKQTPEPIKENKLYILDTFKVEVEPGVAKLCTNFTEYKELFGPFSADDPDNPGKAMHPGHRALTHAVKGFFDNGGTKAFVLRVKTKNIGQIARALETFESIDAIAIVATPGLSDKGIWAELVTHCKTCGDRFAILDCPETVETGGDLDINLLNYDTPNNLLPDKNKNAAFYFPYIEVVDPAKQLQDQDPARNIPSKKQGYIYVPPSGHVAGIYARTDVERGVHKAPANASVLGALNVKYYIGKPKHELLNPQGVNVIRNINGNIMVWGARTIGGDANSEWKYINVRRLFLFLCESIDEGTQWVVFEPNDQALWGKIRRNIGAFLTNVWRSGALFGLTPEQAFYVKCDEETNPPEVRELGQVVTEIGVAIVRPAEFVIFRITQSGDLQAG